MTSPKPIAIIGGGLAGLTAASYLNKKNIPFVLFEAGPKIAGLASSFTDEEGFTHDFGAHFITNRLADAIGIGEQCRDVKHYGEAVWFKRKSYNYPFGLVAIPELSFGYIKDKVNSIGKKEKPVSAADWFRQKYGSALADQVALPLIEAWSGEPAENLSASLGDGLFGGSIFKTFYLKVAGLVSGHAVACGYNREKPETPSVWHVYPENGISTVCEKLADGLNDSIKLNSPVSEIIVENDQVTAVRVNDERFEVAAVISTAPANILSKLVKGTHVLDDTSAFRYRAMTFLNIRLKGEKLLPDTVMWFPEKRFPFFRVTEATFSMPWLAPKGKSILTVDFGCKKGDDIWNMEESQLLELSLKHLEEIIPDIRSRFLGSDVLRTTIAYPVFLKEYEETRKEFERTTNIKKLLSIGRNGEFSHMFMEDVYWRTQKRVGNLISELNE
ncbi:MAG: FAD-dependent oxidoreductase [Ginsengibacter sp.]